MDVTAVEFGPIFVAKNENVALRNFNSMFINNPNVSRKDYLLYLLGFFDTENGSIQTEVDFPLVVNTSVNNKTNKG